MNFTMRTFCLLGIFQILGQFVKVFNSVVLKAHSVQKKHSNSRNQGIQGFYYLQAFLIVEG
jgi:hypothetical protein